MASDILQRPANISLVLGLAVNSYFVFGNLGNFTTGVQAYMRDHTMSADREVKLLNWFIKKGTFTLAPAIVISAALFGVAAYLAPTSIVRQLTLSALAFNLLIPLYTVVFILPTRFELGRLEEAGVQAIEEKSERAKELVRKWNWYHDFRMVLEGFVWVAAVGALQLL